MTTVHDSRPVCLVRPPAVETFRFSSLSITPPLGLAYVAGAIERAGHQVEIVDAVVGAPERQTRYFRGYLVGLGFEEIAARIPADSKVIGITALFTHEWPAIVQLIDHIKRRLPDTPIVLGGEHVTSMPELCLLTSKADYVVLGEGEETVVELLEALDTGMPHVEMLGIGYREGGDVVINARRERTLAIDDIALARLAPDRPRHVPRAPLDGRHVVAEQVGPDPGHPRLPLPVHLLLGAQHVDAAVDPARAQAGGRRDPALLRRVRRANFPFQDLTAIIQRQWIIDFCTELLDRGLDITWQMPTGTRSEAIDDEVAQLLKRTGMISMAYAPESGSEETRKLIKKKMKTDRMLESMRAAVAADLNVMVFMVIGFPHDTDDQIRENLDFFATIAEVGINDAAVGFYMALPGTQIFESLYDSGQINLDRTYFRHILSSTSLWATSTYSGLGRAKLTYWKFKLMRHFYSQQREGAKSEGLLSTVGQAIKSLRNGDNADETKLQSAFRNGVISFIDTAKVKSRPGGWMSRRAERHVFDGWDAIYREIRARNLASGAAVESPADTTELHSRNITKILKSTHGTRRRIPLEVVNS